MTSEAAIGVSENDQTTMDYVNVPSAQYEPRKQAQSKASEHHLVSGGILHYKLHADLNMWTQALSGHEGKQHSTPRKRLRPENGRLSPEEEKRLGRRSTLPKDLHFKKRSKWIPNH